MPKKIKLKKYVANKKKNNIIIFVYGVPQHVFFFPCFQFFIINLNNILSICYIEKPVNQDA